VEGVTLRCLIVDDSPRFREAARGLLERQGARVVGVAATGAEALAQAEQTRPDVALVDIALGAESGFDVADRLDGIPVILISTHDRHDFADLIDASRAIGFLSKSELSEPAIRALLNVCRDAPRDTPARQAPGDGRRPPPAGSAS
jgi:DNA-binding NarL/FixJ family response regulator